MVLLGVDPDKDTHTVVAVDQAGRQLDQRTVPARTLAHGELVGWARMGWPDRLWAVEDCRHVSGRLERDLLAAAERVVRVPPRLLAGARQAVRVQGKSDPIDALAVARAAVGEPTLPVAQHDQASWEVKLLVDHREHLVAERTRQVNRLRWQLHQLDPTWNTRPAGCPARAWVASAPGSPRPPPMPARRAGQDLPGPSHRHPGLTDQLGELDRQLRQRVARLAHRCSACPAADP